MQAYSNPKRATDPHALPDVEVFELTATEVAAMDEDLVYEYSKRHEFRLCFMNSRTNDAMLDAIVEEEGITGGWYWQSCFPGCLPDGDPIGPFATREEALADAQQDAIEEDEADADEGTCMYCGKSIWLDTDGWRHNSVSTLPICNHIPEPKA